MSDRRLLIVEDTQEIAEMLALFFDGRGFQTWIAPTGAQALELGRQKMPHLILLDVGLPDTDGYSLFREIRSSARLRYIPIIFLTKRTKKSDRLAGLELGADDYINKPFDLEELFLRVQNAIQRAARESLTDPRTGLPSATIVRQEMALLPEEGGRRALEFRLLNLEPFLDRYGMLAVTGLLRHTALLLSGALDDCAEADGFVGQSGDTAFTVICAAERADCVCRAAVERFDTAVLQHYSMGAPATEGVRVFDSAGHSHLLPYLRLETAPAGPA
jgi:two-component system catabolic regulation response regulator CreB